MIPQDYSLLYSGIAIQLTPGDPTAGWEIQSSPNGSSSWTTIAQLPPLGSGGGIFIDYLPLDNTARFYQVRHVKLGQNPSAWTATSPASGKPAQLDPATITASINYTPFLAVGQLSAITADVGELTAGQIHNVAGTAGILLSGSLPGGWTTYLNLVATGANPVLHHPKFDLFADGTAAFAGKIDIIGATLAFGAESAFIALRESGVAHGMTSLAPTDVLGFVGELSATQGGMALEGFTETTTGLLLAGTATTGGSSPVVQIAGSLKSGTTRTFINASDVVFAVSNFTNVLFRLLGDGAIQIFNAGGAAVTQRLGGVISAVGDSSTSSSGSSETDLKSYTVPANTLAATYRAVRFEAWGALAANANSKTLRLYYGGTFLDSVVTTLSTNRTWYIRGVIHYTGASAQEIWYEMAVSPITGTAGTQPIVLVNRALPAKSNSADQILKVTGQGVSNGDLVGYTFDVWYTP